MLPRVRDDGLHAELRSRLAQIESCGIRHLARQRKFRATRNNKGRRPLPRTWLDNWCCLCPAQRHLSPRPTAPSPPRFILGGGLSLGRQHGVPAGVLPRTVPLYGRMGTPTLSTARYVKRQRRKVAQDRSTVPQLRSHRGGPVRRYPHHRTCTSTRCGMRSPSVNWNRRPETTTTWSAGCGRRFRWPPEDSLYDAS